jgi:serine/threonine-protein kinase RsbW
MVSSVRHELMCESFWELRIPSQLKLANDVVERFVERVEACGVSGSESLALRHGIHEAMVNAILHGNGGDSSRHVRVAYGFCGNEVWIEVEDEGPGFRAEQVADPRTPQNAQRPAGRGLLMMNHFMNSVEYNDRGNRVTTRRDCSLGEN